MKKIKFFCFSLLYILFLFLLFFHTKDVLLAVINGVDLFKTAVFPSLFPFLIISHMMIDYGFIEIIKELLKPLMYFFKIHPNASFIVAMSFLSGSSSNAKYTKELYQKQYLSKEEAEKVLTFSYFSSPLFILGTLSIFYLKNQAVGLWIFIIHVLSNIFVGFLFRNYGNISIKKEKIQFKKGLKQMYQKAKTVSITKSMTHSIKESLLTCGLILGSIVFLLVITTCIQDFLPQNPYISASIKGVFEMTQGLKELSVLSLPMRYKGTLSILLLSFGGLSIYIQIISILSDTDLSVHPYFLARLLHAAISGLLFYFLYPFI